MSEIPSDIRAAAEAVVERGYNEGLIDAVCKALMVERERCAKIADAHSECERDCGDVIADAIRRGTPHASPLEAGKK